eukprot:500562-Prymnesium_polylepis.1
MINIISCDTHDLRQHHTYHSLACIRFCIWIWAIDLSFLCLTWTQSHAARRGPSQSTLRRSARQSRQQLAHSSQKQHSNRPKPSPHSSGQPAPSPTSPINDRARAPHCPDRRRAHRVPSTLRPPPVRTAASRVARAILARALEPL